MPCSHVQVEVIQRHGQPLRRIGIVSAQGHRTRFVLQFHTKHLTRVESRMNQVHCAVVTISVASFFFLSFVFCFAAELPVEYPAT